MVSALNSRLSSPGLSPGWGHCVVFIGKARLSHSASLHPGVQMGTGEFNAGKNLIPSRKQKYSQSLVATDKLNSGPIFSYAEFFLIPNTHFLNRKIECIKSLPELVLPLSQQAMPEYCTGLHSHMDESIKKYHTEPNILYDRISCQLINRNGHET